MNRENTLKLMFAAVLALFAAAAVYYGNTFQGPRYAAPLFIGAFCAALFLLVELYLRVQRNIIGVHSRLEHLKHDLSGLQGSLEARTQAVDQKIAKAEEDYIYELRYFSGTLDKMLEFNESLLQFLETEKKEGSRSAEHLARIESLQISLNSSIEMLRRGLQHGESRSAKSAELTN